MSPQRRDAEGNRQAAHSCESLVERLIRVDPVPGMERLERAFNRG